MGLTVRNKGGGDFRPIPEGVHVGICYGVYDLGTHFDERYNKSVHKIRINWEIPSERITVERNGKKVDMPRAIGQTYTASLSPKANLRKMLEAWRGKAFTEKQLDGFDLKALAGKACQIQVIHVHKDDKTYANVAGIMAIPKGMAVPESENEFQWFSFEENFELPEGLPEWIVDIIKGSQEWSAVHGGSHDDDGAPPNDEPPDDYEPGQDDDMPF